mmetsp:Transcript_29961/g.84518  ORF Transcript_29961/g.84518 Transcript_29961/m.84518 type:complete len:241 (-) Transcript_29961:314-1036(-)
MDAGRAGEGTGGGERRGGRSPGSDQRQLSLDWCSHSTTELPNMDSGGPCSRRRLVPDGCSACRIRVVVGRPRLAEDRNPTAMDDALCTAENSTWMAARLPACHLFRRFPPWHCTSSSPSSLLLLPGSSKGQPSPPTASPLAASNRTFTAITPALFGIGSPASSCSADAQTSLMADPGDLSSLWAQRWARQYFMMRSPTPVTLHAKPGVPRGARRPRGESSPPAPSSSSAAEPSASLLSPA